MLNNNNNNYLLLLLSKQNFFVETFYELDILYFMNGNFKRFFFIYFFIEIKFVPL